MHQEREYPGRVSGSDLFNPDFALLARAYGWASALVAETAAFEPALRTALERRESTLLHLILRAEVSTSRTTLSAIRAAAYKDAQP
jgi:acetolactate synthase-1/2/3 large subunit